ncbi:MAG: hypothetical protein ACYCSF_02960 [Acidimicrobiales bacterium]
MPLAVRPKSARPSSESAYEQSPPAEAGRRARDSLLGRPVKRPDPRGRRQPRFVALGLTLVVTCAALGAEMARRTDQLSSYLALTQPVAAGELLHRSDLISLPLHVPPDLGVIPASDARGIVGRRVSETLVAGSVLVAADLLAGTAPLPGTALVGTSLQPDQVPSNLQLGDSVLVVLAGAAGAVLPASAPPGAPVTSTGPSSNGSGPGPTVLGQGTVFAVGGGSQGGAPAGGGTSATDLTISVMARDASVIAAASAAGEVSLVEIPPGSSVGSRAVP